MEHVKSTIEHREPIIVRFLLLQYAKLRMLELYYNFFDQFLDVRKFENSKRIQIPSFCNWQKKIQTNVPFPASEQNRLKSEAKTVEKFSEQMRKTTSPRTCCFKHKKHDKTEPGFSKEEFRFTKMLYRMCSKTYYCYNSISQKYKFSSSGHASYSLSSIPSERPVLHAKSNRR